MLRARHVARAVAIAPFREALPSIDLAFLAKTPSDLTPERNQMLGDVLLHALHSLGFRGARMGELCVSIDWGAILSSDAHTPPPPYAHGGQGGAMGGGTVARSGG